MHRIKLQQQQRILNIVKEFSNPFSWNKHHPSQEVCDNLANFFQNKIPKIYRNFKPQPSPLTSSTNTTALQPPQTTDWLNGTSLPPRTPPSWTQSTQGAPHWPVSTPHFHPRWSQISHKPTTLFDFDSHGHLSWGLECRGQNPSEETISWPQQTQLPTHLLAPIPSQSLRKRHQPTTHHISRMELSTWFFPIQILQQPLHRNNPNCGHQRHSNPPRPGRERGIDPPGPLCSIQYSPSPHAHCKAAQHWHPSSRSQMIASFLTKKTQKNHLWSTSRIIAQPHPLQHLHDTTGQHCQSPWTEHQILSRHRTHPLPFRRLTNTGTNFHNCMTSVTNWIKDNCLKLNTGKT